MAVLLALGSAVAYGLSDFVGGLASRQASAWSVALVAQLSGATGTAVAAAIGVAGPGTATPVHLAWGLLAGLGAGTGTGFLYRGLAEGRMTMVAPVSAIGAALVPVVVGVVSGERPGATSWMGIGLALPGVWLVSSHEDAAAPAGAARGDTAAAVVDGLLAGTGFGVMFAALAQVPASAGLWPLVAAQALAVVTVALLAVALRAAWRPRQTASAWGLLAGPLAAAAVLAFLLASHGGLLAVVAVLASLYPAVTVLLAATALREHIHRLQAVGLALCTGAVVLVAVG